MQRGVRLLMRTNDGVDAGEGHGERRRRHGEGRARRPAELRVRRRVGVARDERDDGCLPDRQRARRDDERVRVCEVDRVRQVERGVVSCEDARPAEGPGEVGRVAAEVAADGLGRNLHGACDKGRRCGAAPGPQQGSLSETSDRRGGRQHARREEEEGGPSAPKIEASAPRASTPPRNVGRSGATSRGHGRHALPSPANPNGHGPQVNCRPVGSCAAGTSLQGTSGKHGLGGRRQFPGPCGHGCFLAVGAAQPSMSTQPLSPAPWKPAGHGLSGRRGRRRKVVSPNAS